MLSCRVIAVVLAVILRVSCSAMLAVALVFVLASRLFDMPVATPDSLYLFVTLCCVGLLLGSMIYGMSRSRL